MKRKVNENKGIFDAKELASYIKYKYSILPNKISQEISPLKLQKSLYFCFAYWGGFVRKGKNMVDVDMGGMYSSSVLCD